MAITDIYLTARMDSIMATTAWPGFAHGVGGFNHGAGFAHSVGSFGHGMGGGFGHGGGGHR